MLTRMRDVTSIAVLMTLAPASLVATALVPRKSPELKVFNASGGQTPLSSFKGKVVVAEFLLTDCRHCERVSQVITKLHKELGPRGFQPIGIAFDVGITGERVSNFVRRLGVTFPVGYVSSRDVDLYLGRLGPERLMVPQLVVIDRTGVIRAQSVPINEQNLENEVYLRNLVETLLKEKG